MKKMSLSVIGLGFVASLLSSSVGKGQHEMAYLRSQEREQVALEQVAVLKKYIDEHLADIDSAKLASEATRLGLQTTSVWYGKVLRHFLAKKVPLKLKDSVIADGRLIGEVRGVNRNGTQVAVQLVGSEELQIFPREQVARQVGSISGFRTGDRVSKSFFSGTYTGTIRMLFENKVAKVEYKGFEGKWYPTLISDLKK